MLLTLLWMAASKPTTCKFLLQEDVLYSLSQYLGTYILRLRCFSFADRSYHLSTDLFIILFGHNQHKIILCFSVCLASQARQCGIKKFNQIKRYLLCLLILRYCSGSPLRYQPFLIPRSSYIINVFIITVF
jgi:hypothetical protein